MTKTFIISFSAPIGTDYAPLFQAIKGYGTWARITKTTWAIVTEEKASEVRDYLLGFMPSGSRIFIIKSAAVAAWRNVVCSSEWLKKNL